MSLRSRWPAPLPTWTAALFAVALLCAATSADSARAEEGADYRAGEAELEQLLYSRQAEIANLSRWTSAEQAALQQLAPAETKLHALIVEQADLSIQRDDLAQQVAQLDQRRVGLAQRRAEVARRVELEQTVLSRWPARQVAGVLPWAEGEVDGLFQLAEVDTALADCRALTESARQAQAANVAQLGRANTEVTFWENQAAVLAGRVGESRSLALAASASLAEIQISGLERSAALAGQFASLMQSGVPVDVAPIAASDALPIPEPLVWPEDLPSYALTAGRTNPSLVADSPSFIGQDRLTMTGVAGDLSWKAPVVGPITTPFGDATPFQSAHYALDIGARLYDPVVAAAEGVVEFAGLAASDNRLASYGLAVLIRHDDHLSSLYAHLDDRAHGLAVTAGETVRQGQVLGYVGLTGYSTGPHLHFEVRFDNQPIDPLLVIRP